MKSSGIGGQAVLEGVMMRNKDQYAVAVRKPNGQIVVDKGECKSIREKIKFFNLPLIRGVVSFVESLTLGMKLLTSSADYFDDSNEKPGKFEAFLQKKLGKKADKVITGFTVFLSIILAIAIFMLLPLVVVSFLPEKTISYQWKTLFEGLIRLAVFILYIILISRMKDIRRVFMYHGAEHKTINCIEKGLPPTVQNVRRCSRLHKRCGTSFLLFVMLISIVFFLIFRVETLWIRFVTRILFVPVIAGLSYEFIRLAGSSDSKIIGFIAKPGLWLQGLTTREPDDKMIKVAVASVEAVFDWQQFLKENFGNRENRKVKHANNDRRDRKPVPALSKATEKKQEPIQAVEKPAEAKQEPIQAVEKPVEAKQEPIQAVEKTVEVKQEPIQVVEKPVEVKQEPAKAVEKPSSENLIDHFDFSFPKETSSKGASVEISEEEAALGRDKLKAKVLVPEASKQIQFSSAETAAGIDEDEEEEDPILRALDKFFVFEGKTTVMEQTNDRKPEKKDK